VYVRISRNKPFGTALIAALIIAAAVFTSTARADDEKEAGEKETAATVTHDGEAAGHDDEGHGDEGHGDAAHGGDAHGGGHSDPHDLMHANSDASLTDPAEFKSDLAIFSAIVFLLLMAILGKFAWGPIAAGLDAREQGIANQIAEANRLAEEAQQTLVRYQAQVAGAAEEVRQMLDKGRRDADAQRQEIIAEAQQVAQREKERAISEIQHAKNEALQEVAQRSADTAVALASQIVRRELNKDDHARLIADAIQQFPSKN